MSVLSPDFQPTEGLTVVSPSFLPLVLRTISPLHQGVFRDSVRSARLTKRKNFLPIRSTEFWFADHNGWVEVPTASGNALRGRIRRLISQDYFSKVQSALHTPSPLLAALLASDISLSTEQRSLLQLFMSGGTLAAKLPAPKPGLNAGGGTGGGSSGQSASTSSAASPPKQYYAIRQTYHRNAVEPLFPMLTLLGYADGDKQLIPGKVAFTDLVPLFAETYPTLQDWPEIHAVLQPFLGQALPSWLALVTRSGSVTEPVRWPRHAFVRSDPSHRVFNQYGDGDTVDGPDDDNDDATADNDVESKSQMIVTMEYIPPHQAMFGGLYMQQDLTPVERGALYRGIDLLMDQGVLGGQSGRGYGRVAWQYRAEQAADYRESLQAYDEHAAQSAPAIAELLPDVLELRQKKEKAKKK